MILLCERCWSPVDPVGDRFYRLAHLAHADAHGDVTWRDAVVHTEPCGPLATAPHADGRRDRAA